MVWRVTSWEKYKALSPEQREEYQFRFGKVEVDMPVSLGTASMFLLTTSVVLFAWYFYWTINKEESIQLGLLITSIVRIIGWAVVAEGIAWILQKVYFGVKEYHWYKNATRGRL